MNNLKQTPEQPSLIIKQLWHRRLPALLLLILLSGFLVTLLPGKTKAAQITSRSLTLTSAIVSATGVTYTYGFTTATAGTIQTIQFQACTTALGTCTAPTGLNINLGSPTLGTGWQSATAFARDVTGGGGCTPANNVLCLKRTSGVSENAVAKTISESTQTNPSGASCASSNPNCTFFIRITIYSDTGWATPVDTGTVASSTVATLTISASVAEVLNFCIGTTAIDNATSTPGADCSAISGTSVNLGTLDSGTLTITPVNVNGGNNVNGIAMLRTNAGNGTTVSYRAIQAGSGTNHLGGLRVTGATCAAGASNTDQCIDSQGGTQGTFTAGTEKFGMTVAGTNCGSTTSYTCTFTSGSNNLKASSNYIGATSTTYGTSSGFAWDESGSFVQIASSTGSSTSAVDDEALILKFGATPSIVTPTGSYSVQSDFLVVSTY